MIKIPHATDSIINSRVLTSDTLSEVKGSLDRSTVVKVDSNSQHRARHAYLDAVPTNLRSVTSEPSKPSQAEAEPTDQTATASEDGKPASARPAGEAVSRGAEVCGADRAFETPNDGASPTLARIGLPGLIAAAFVVAAVVVRQRHFFPQGDLAVMELKLRDLVSHPPLVGAYSRFEWSHPGPVMYYALWPVYRLFGASSSSVMAATLVWHGVWFSMAIGLAVRRGGQWAGAVGSLVMVAVVLGTGADLLLYPWNPYLNISVFLAFIVACWGALDRDRLSVAATCIAGTVLVQDHVGLVVVVAMSGTLLMLVWAFGAAHSRSSGAQHETGQRLGGGIASTDSPAQNSAIERLHRYRWPIFGAAVSFVLWLPPIVEQLRHSPGNVGLLVRFFRNSGANAQQRVGLGSAIRIVSQYFSVRAPWTGGSLVVEGIGGGISPVSMTLTRWPVVIVLGFAALALAVKVRNATLANVLLLELGLAGVSVVATAAISGTPFPYLLIWVNAVSAAMAATSIATFATIARNRWGLRSSQPADRSEVPTVGSAKRSPRVGSLAPSIIVTLAAVAMSVATVRSPSPYDDRAQIIGDLSAQMSDELPPGQPLWFAPPTSEEARTFVTGLMVQMEHSGHNSTTVTEETLAIGAHRTRSQPSGATTIVVAEGPTIAELQEDPNATPIAFIDQFGTRDWDRLQQLQAKTDAVLSDPRDDPQTRNLKAAMIDQVLKFKRNRLRVTVFELDS